MEKGGEIPADHTAGRLLCWIMGAALFLPMEVRTLCPRCRANYLDAGYRLRLIPGRYRQPCDLCTRPGNSYSLEDQDAQSLQYLRQNPQTR